MSIDDYWHDIRKLRRLLSGCELYSEDGTVFIKCNGHRWWGNEVCKGWHAEDMEDALQKIQNWKGRGRKQ